MLKGALIMLSVVAGVMAGYHSGTVWPAFAMILLAVAVRVMAVRIMLRNLKYINLTARLHTVWPCLLLCGLALLSARLSRPLPEELPLRIPCMLSGEVEDGETTTMGGRYLVRLHRVRAEGGEELICHNTKVWLFASALHPLEPGDEIRWESLLLPTDEQRPGGVRYMAHDMVRIYDGKRHKSSGKERYTLRNGNLTVTGASHSLQSMAWRCRYKIAILLETSGLSDDSARLLRALITGERSGMRPERRDLFRDAGVSHTLAVSGMHVGIIAGLLIWLTLPLNLLPGAGRWRLVPVLAGVWLFTIFTGMMYSTLRAALMITLAGVGRLMGRNVTPFYGVCMAGVVILLLAPDALWDVGFQLSFLCVAGLCLFMQPLNPVNMRHHKRLYGVVSMMLITLVATGMTWPVTARYFGAIPLNFMFCNFVMAPILPVLMMAGMVHILLVACGVQWEWLAWGIDHLVQILYAVLETGGQHVLDLSPSGWTVTLWLAAVALFAFGIHRHRCVPRWLPGAIVAPVARRADGGVPLYRPPLYAAALLALLALILV